jgi:hypothetical protein
MKAIVSALLAVSVLAGIAAPTSALDTNVLGGRTPVEQDRIVYWRRRLVAQPSVAAIGLARCRDKAARGAQVTEKLTAVGRSAYRYAKEYIMLKTHLYLGLEALLAIAIATGVNAADDNPDAKRCGGYYACIELQPAQPDSPGHWQMFLDPASK